MMVAAECKEESIPDTAAILGIEQNDLKQAQKLAGIKQIGKL